MATIVKSNELPARPHALASMGAACVGLGLALAWFCLLPFTVQLVLSLLGVGVALLGAAARAAVRAHGLFAFLPPALQKYASERFDCIDELSSFVLHLLRASRCQCLSVVH